MAGLSGHAGTTFRALRHRNFRLLWLGQTGHSATMWMDQVARAVLILELTDSALMLSLVIATRLLPILLFGLIAGAVADRSDRKKVLVTTQGVTFGTYVFLGAVTVFGFVETWHVFATALVSGTAMAFNQPVRQSLIPMTVPREDLLNAIALNSTALSLMRIGGGSVAGLLLIVMDVGEIYLVTSSIYIGVIVSTSMMSFPPREVAKAKTALTDDLREGFAYVAANPTLLLVTGLALILFILGFPYQQVFVPLLATDTLGLGDSGVGFLMGATGFGAFAGSLFVAAKSDIRRPGLQLAINMLIFGVALTAISLQATVLGTALFLAVAGSMTVTYMSLTNSILLEHSTPEMHGRVMSLLSLDRGLIPLGAILGGVLASAIGIRPGLFVLGTAVTVCSTLVLLLLGRRLAAIPGGAAVVGHHAVRAAQTAAAPPVTATGVPSRDTAP